jgi:predicted ABC-type ATPase
MECPANRFDLTGANCVISTRKASNIINDAFNGKKPRTPIFFIKYGPPASGKGGIMKKVLVKENITDKSLVTIEVDSIIESNTKYKSEREKIANAKDRTALYWKWRGESDAISDQILNHAILNGYDIDWETTGGTIDWTLKEINRIKRQGYIITVVYPLVPADTLVKRALIREKETGQTPASEDQIRSGVTKAINNLVQIIDHVDNIYIYDNSGSKGDEYVVIEINNGNGKKDVSCDCTKLKSTLSAKFASEVVHILEDICKTACHIKK